MKRMYSEEELLETTNTENLVDSKGRNRFIVGNGEPRNVSGMTVASSKWTLNGNNLVFEILGTFTENLSAGTLCMFDLPDWIVSKIATPYNNIIDIIDCKIVFLDASATTIRVQITADGGNIYFTNVTDATVSSIGIFKIRYNTIIDNE